MPAFVDALMEEWAFKKATTAILDAKRVHVFHEVLRDDTGRLVATAEQMLVHVDTHAGRATALPEHLLARLLKIRTAHAALPQPAAVGHVMRIPHPEGGT